MEEVIWSQQAKLDLFHIWKFYSSKNLKAADKVIGKIIETAETITFSTQYQKEEFLEEWHRRALYKHFKIIYSVRNNNLLVLRIFDSRQNPSKMIL